MIIISLLLLYLCLWVVAYQRGHVTIMLSPNDHDYDNIICCIIQYVKSHNCISNIFVAVSYVNHVSQYNSFILLLHLPPYLSCSVSSD